MHKRPGHVVGNHAHVDVVLPEFPGGEPRALKKGPGFVRQNLEPLAILDRRAYHAQRSAIAGRGQRSRVAVRQYRSRLRQQLGAELSHAFVVGDVFVVDRLRFVNENLRDCLASRPGFQRFAEGLFHPFDRPEQVHGRRPGSGERGGDGFKVPLECIQVLSIGLEHSERHAHSRRHAYCGSTAHHHHPDGFRHFFVSPKRRVLFHGWQLTLVDHAHAVFSPFNGLDQRNS